MNVDKLQTNVDECRRMNVDESPDACRQMKTSVNESKNLSFDTWFHFVEIVAIMQQ